ncbi:MAG: nitroreductase family protein [Candidatus Zixiibacteriota bacterium]|nr:MAG: nitroreductase family protein [candidate division Zixibacteria bacterium]
MSGIIFFRTKGLAEISKFYIERIGCQVWQNQGDCIILKHGNLLIGFCERVEIDREGLLTFFYEQRDQVDQMYEVCKDIAPSPPAINDKYHIYHFFAHDPERRKLEFQYFDHPLKPYLSAEELLVTRRSVRKFKTAAIDEDILNQIVEKSRFAPTSHNTQGYYFRVITDRNIVDQVAATRGANSAPIARAPMAVAICCDPALTKRPVQDACIAAYHFILAAWCFGLGTCWIAAMDRDDVKEMLGIPKEHYISTITPLGYPEEIPIKTPPRKDISWFLR